MTLKVIQGLVSPFERAGTEVSASARSADRVASQSQATPPQNPLHQSLESVVIAAKNTSNAGEAVITTVRSIAKAPASSELRSSDEAEKLARKIAREVSGDGESEALFAHSGLDTVGRSGRGGSLL